MKPVSLFLFLLTAAVLNRAGLGAHAETQAEEALYCTKSATFLAPADVSTGRKYAPDRSVVVTHLALDVTPDFKHRTIQATATLRVKAINRPAPALKLDAVDLNIQTVKSSEKIQAYDVAADQLTITFATPLAPDREATVTVTYSTEPKEGLYFRTPEMGYPAGDTHLFSQGEEIEARHWYPCLDAPNQQFTSEITCRVPDGMTVISNGRLVSQERDAASGLTAFHWSQEKPHANYLVSLVAGYFKKLEDKCGEIPLGFYTPPSEFKQAASSFRDTKDMVAFFQREIGVSYPWAKYDQVCVHDFVAGGMENTSATTLTDRTLFTEATENIHDSVGLVSHELAHQWFGDLVTCKDWSQVWLNEGFATYYETLYNGHKNGRDALLYELYQRRRDITSRSNDLTPIVRRDFGQPGEMFGYLVYPKAGWVLHMLRCQLGEDLFRRGIQTYLKRHEYGLVVTDDLRAVLEELSGRSFDQFMDQWLYHGHFPELKITYEWDERARLARLSVRQEQEVNPQVLLFNLPLAVRLKGAFGVIDREIQVSKKEEDFYIPAASAPQLVRVDPELTLLAKITFPVPKPMLQAQLAEKQDVVGRLLAVAELGRNESRENIASLKQTLQQDAFYGVRVEAARALRSLHTDEALDALLACQSQPDARVRLAVVEAIGGFYREKAYAALRATLEREKNPAILSVAIRSLGTYWGSEVRHTIVEFLNSTSYRNELADAAVQAARSQEDPEYITSLTETLGRKEAEFTSRGFGQGLEALGYLARNETNKDATREFLLARVNHPRRTVRVAALRSLGQLGDARAMPVVEKFANAGTETPERRAAQAALGELRAARKPSEELQSLRQEVLDLQKANRELRKDFDALKKKLEAAPPPKTKR